MARPVDLRLVFGWVGNLYAGVFTSLALGLGLVRITLKAL